LRLIRWRAAASSIELFHSREVDEIVDRIVAADVRVAGVDSPCAWAEPGERSRRCERDFVALRLCGIRFSPDEATALARSDAYFEWIWNGLSLWHALERAGVSTLEVFPTASWTAWSGGRGSQRRAAWTRAALAELAVRGVSGLEPATNQDRRDAVAAALTTRQWSRAPDTVHVIDRFVVPRAGSVDAAAGRSPTITRPLASRTLG